MTLDHLSLFPPMTQLYQMALVIEEKRSKVTFTLYSRSSNPSEIRRVTL
jgi:hypothetical protein